MDESACAVCVIRCLTHMRSRVTASGAAPPMRKQRRERLQPEAVPAALLRALAQEACTPEADSAGLERKKEEVGGREKVVWEPDRGGLPSSLLGVQADWDPARP